MGEFADYFNEEQEQSVENLMSFLHGDMDHEEAMEAGILDENGLLDDMKSVQVWISGGKVCEPTKMTTAHLRNAIAYARRTGMYGPAVDALHQELRKRNGTT